MKKITGVLFTLAVILALAVTVSAADSSHPHGSRGHCVCGGAAVGVGDHESCETVEEWTPLYGTVDFGKLKSGYYYLTGNVTVTAASGIGTKKSELTLEPEAVVDLTVCLNGYNITREKDKVFGYLRMNSSLTVCDCSYDIQTGTFGGTVTGGTGTHGSILYSHAGSTVNIYGGNYVGNAYQSGGAFGIASDFGGDLDGDGDCDNTDKNAAAPSVMNLYNGHITGSTVTSKGGTIVIYHASCLNMYGGTVTGGTVTGTGSGNGIGGNIYSNKGTVIITGGTVTGGTAAVEGGNIYAGNLYMLGGSVTDGTVNGVREAAMVIDGSGRVLGTYTTLAQAVQVSQSTENTFVRLAGDLEEETTLSGTVYLDLNGCDLRGVTVTGTLYGMDSTTLGYDGAKAGTLTPVSGAPALTVKTAAERTGAIYRFLAVEEDGSYSFHRFYIGITKLSLKPTTAGMGYKAVFAGDEAVKAALNTGYGFGYSLWLEGGSPVTRAYGAERFQTTQELTLRVDNFLSTENSDAANAARAEMNIHAKVFIRLADGTEISSSEVSYNFRELLQTADGSYSAYTQTQQAALQTLSATYSPVMLGWDVSNIHHADGSIWTPVDTAAFTAALYKSGTNYIISPGNYVLTEDITLSGKILRVAAGKTVSICLNGHTLTDDVRIFRVFGTLNICDCHRDGLEGNLLSTYTAEEGASGYYAPVLYAYYNSTVNLYGGNLIATGQMNSAGVVAVSHDGDSTNTAQVPAVFNMYGGTISGGSSLAAGGLISLWNGSTFNLYAGTLSGGTAGTNGGAVSMSSNCTFNMYGGTVTDCSSALGGNIYNSKGTVNLYGGTVSGGTSSGSGGNIYLYSGTLNMAGGTVTGGTANALGGGVYVNGGQCSLSGDARILENTGSNLYLDIYADVDAQGLTENARVGMTVEGSRALGQDLDLLERVFSDEAEHTVRQIYGNISIVPTDLAEQVTVDTGFSVGFGQSSITPEQIEGIPLGGYGNGADRLAEAQELAEYDELIAQTVAITDAAGQTVLLITCDMIRPNADFTSSITKAVTAATGVPEGNIIVTASHSHSTPEITLTGNDRIIEYNASLPDQFARSAAQAMADRQNATMESGSFEVQTEINGTTRYLNFVRHYSYTDAEGILQYFGDNFGTATYNSTTEHVWEADHTMRLVRFTRDGKDILLANWQVHPHRTGGSEKYKVSADIVGTTRYYMEQKTDMYFVYFNGAAGNINSTSRLSKYNHGLDYVAYGEVLAECIIENLSCLESRESGLIQVDNCAFTATHDHSDDDKYEAAAAFKALYNTETAGMTASEKSAYVKAAGYSSIYEVNALISRYKRSESAVIPLNVITIGDALGIFTAPGELWDTVGIAVESASPFATTLCLGYAQEQNNYFVYYPDSIAQGIAVPYESYEYYNRRFVTPDTILRMITYWTETLQAHYLSANGELNSLCPDNPEGTS